VLEPTAENTAKPFGISDGWDAPGATRENGVTRGRRLLTDEELSLLGLYFTVVKLLFTMGRLDLVPAVLRATEPGRLIEKVSRTPMKNEHAYYTTIALVMQYFNAPEFADPRPLLGSADPTEGKLYVCADSHSLPMSWQQLDVAGVPTVTINRLVTGLKIWHLRDEGRFFPKRNFEAVVKTIPEGADALFCFGEIDCREGIMRALEKGYHANVGECLEALLQIYASTLVRVKRQRKLRRVFVLAPLPVLDVTRHIVVAFNETFRKFMVKQTELIMVDATNDLLVSPAEGTRKPHEIPLSMGEGRVLRSDLALDNTHISPRFVKAVLEPAINASLGQQ